MSFTQLASKWNDLIGRPENESLSSVISLALSGTSLSVPSREIPSLAPGYNLYSIDETDWNRFSMQLDEELSQIQVPLCMECKNVHCKEDSHIRRMDDYTKNVLDAVDRSINNVAKKNRSNISKAKVVPGWSEIVSPFADEAKFWSAIWVSAGKPLNTSLHHIMKRTRNRNHYAIRVSAREPLKIYLKIRC